MPIGTKNKAIEGSGLHHVSIQTRDWEASLRLYRDVLGMEVVREFGPPERKAALLDIGDGCLIELFAPTPDTPSVGSPAANDLIKHVALATTDTCSALEHVRRAGYEVTMEPTDFDLNGMAVVVAFFNGPNGESIEFFQTKE